MNITAIVEQARDLHVLVLTDTITVERLTGGVTVDDLGTETPAWAPTHATATVPALVQAANVGEKPADSTGQPVTHMEYVTKVALDTDVRHGDRITITASLDPRHVGKVVMVEADETQGLATVRRLRCTRTL